MNSRLIPNFRNFFVSSRWKANFYVRSKCCLFFLCEARVGLLFSNVWSRGWRPNYSVQIGEDLIVQCSLVEA